MQENIQSESCEVYALSLNDFIEDAAENGNSPIRVSMAGILRETKSKYWEEERGLQTSKASLEQTKSSIQGLQKELICKEKDFAQCQDHLIDFKGKSGRTIDEYEKKLNTLRETIYALKSKERVDFHALKEKKESLEEKLHQLDLEKDNKKKAGEVFLNKVIEKTVSYIEECTTNRDNAARAVFQAAKDKIERLKQLEKAVDDLLTNASNE